MFAFSPPSYGYTLSADDRIESVDDQWLAFAQENGARELTKEAVVGRSLWDFIAGDNTQDVYKALFQRVRKSCTEKILPFRCDSPTLRRNMIMRIGAESPDRITVQCVLMNAEPTQYLPPLDLQVRRSKARLTVCSVCLRTLLEPSGWLDIEDVVLRLQLLDKRNAPRLFYTVCPRCQALSN